jgi:hypothetical protein
MVKKGSTVRVRQRALNAPAVRSRSGSDPPGASGGPPAGYFTKRTVEDWLRSVLDEARRGTLPGRVRTGATFAEAAAEWLRYVEDDWLR